MDAGRAYRRQAMELVMACRLLVEISPQEAQHDALFKEVMLAADEALRSATKAGKKITDEASVAFIEAQRRILQYEATAHPKSGVLEVAERMTQAKEDRRSLNRRYTIRDTYHDYDKPTVTVNFVLLRSLLGALHDPDPFTVPLLLSSRPQSSEILLNLSRLEGRSRITLQQNPRFYVNLPAHEGAFGPEFSMDPTVDFHLRHNDTIYILVDRPGRVFLKTGRRNRIFSNVWMVHGTLIFKDLHGRLEGERLVRRDISTGAMWYCEPLVLPNSASLARLNHGCIPAITTTSNNPAAGTDWTFLSQPALNFFNVHIFDGASPPAFTEGTVCLSAFGTPHGSDTRTLTTDLPSPPTSEQPGYHVLYTAHAIDLLNDDALLGVFSYYRSDNEINWNTQLGWRKLSHVCRRWRYLVYGSATHLNMQIICTNGTPLVDTLVHLPPLPLVIDYQYATATVSAQDELGIFNALQLRDRIRRVVLRVPPSILDQSLVLMDETFPNLEHLSLSSTAEDDTLLLPQTFLSPNLRHLTLIGIGLPKKMLLLSSTVSLITLTLANIRAPGYFLPRHLVIRLRPFSQLEELTIGFSIPLPRPSAEKGSLQELEAPVTLPVLKRLTFRGVSAYLDSFVAQIRAPLLEQLRITLFNQIAFALPHLSRFTNTTEGLELLTAKIIFERDAFSIVADHHRQQLGDEPPSFSLHVICKQFDWQIDGAAQICSALMAALSGVEQLALDFEGQRVPREWQDDVVDGATWRELLGPFIGVRELRICHALALELSCALRPDDTGSDPGLLPSLEELIPELDREHASNAFSSFIDARQVAGRQVLLSPSPVLHEQSAAFSQQHLRQVLLSPSPVLHEQSAAFSQQHLRTSQVSPDHDAHNLSPASKQGSWLRRTVINPIRRRLG